MKHCTIQCRGISKHYGDGESRIDALRGIDLDIHQGELTLMVGPSGSGKTTLLSIITTILRPDSGRLLLLGHEVSAMTEMDRAYFCLHNLGVVYQSLYLIPTLSVVENVSLPLIIAGQDREAANAASMVILDKMHLAHRAEVSPYTLSKGQQQRVAIARAMVNNSKIIVCDEPTSALDQTVGLEIMALLHELAVGSSRTVLVVTHDHRIFHFADRIINMNDGQITREGT